jgi:hypothetical protein
MASAGLNGEEDVKITAAQWEHLCYKTQNSFRRGVIDEKFSTIVKVLSYLGWRYADLRPEVAASGAKLWLQATEQEIKAQFETEIQKSEILKAKGDLVNAPPTRFLIEGLLPERSITILHGTWASSKTFVALDIALSIQSGVPWQLAKTKKVERGPILYCCFEGQGGLRKRVRSWEIARKTVVDEFLHVTENIFRKGYGHGVELLTSMVQTLPQRPVLLVLDTLRSVILGVEENSAKEIGLFVDLVEELRRRLQCAVMIVHHTSRAGGKGGRGSTVLPGAADVILKTTISKDHFTLGWEKMKDEELPTTISFDLLPIAIDDENFQDRSCAPIIHREGVDGWILRKCKAGILYTTQMICNATEKDTSVVRKALKKLESEGLMEDLGEGSRKQGGLWKRV